MQHSTALLYACRTKSAALVRQLLKADADAQLGDERGMTTLMYAVTNDAADVTRLILTARPSCVNLQDINGWAALHWAVRFSCVVFVHSIQASLKSNQRAYHKPSPDTVLQP